MNVMDAYRQAKAALDAYKEARRIWYGDDKPEVAVWREVSAKEDKHERDGH